MKPLSKARIEAFSDGVIAILITVMVFDLKLGDVSDASRLTSEFFKLVPRFGSYVVSFLLLAIMWMNHHRLFSSIRHADDGVLYRSIHLLFWMSLVPFVTSFIGSNPLLWQATTCYGIVFFMCGLAFTLLRGYVTSHDLLTEHINPDVNQRIQRKNRITLVINVLASIIGYWSVYPALILFAIVPVLYIRSRNH